MLQAVDESIVTCSKPHDKWLSQDPSSGRNAPVACVSSLRRCQIEAETGKLSKPLPYPALLSELIYVTVMQ